MAGATAVEVGTYNFMNPNGGAEIISDLERYLGVDGYVAAFGKVM